MAQAASSHTDNDELLDLVDLALLLNYERATTDPLFRHCKLKEVAYPGEKPQTVLFTSQTASWLDNARTFFIFDQMSDPEDGPDLPSNMVSLDSDDQANLGGLGPEKLETIFYQARGFDGCYKSVTLLQHFLDLFEDPMARVRVRHGPKGKKPGHSYVTTINRRRIIEQTLLHPKYTTASIVLPEALTHVTGHSETFLHACMAFYAEDADTATSTLDLASMMYGDLGRGPGSKGKGLFALDTVEEYQERLQKLAQGNDPEGGKTSARIGPSEHDEWLKKVAQRAKERWDRRETEKWCGHCGGPGPNLSRCSGCGEAWFCSQEHQKMAWPFHKGYCKK